MKKQQDEILHLVEKATNGDKKAFAELCYKKGPSILHRCIQLMGNTTDGQDASQEVFIKLQAGIARLKSPQAFGVWLHRLITNTCNTVRTKQAKSLFDLPEEEAGDTMIETKTEMLPQAYLEDADKRRVLLELVGKLPAGMRDCVLLYYYEDLAVKDIASILGSSEDAINMQLYRARLKIRAQLEAQDHAAYNSALVPFAAISGVIHSQIEVGVSPAMVEACIRKAGIGRPNIWRAAQKAAPAALVAALAAVLVAATVFVSSATPEQGDVPQRPPAQGAVKDMDADPSVPQQTAPPAPSLAAPVEPDAVTWQPGSGAMVGMVYLKDFSTETPSTWNMMQGAAVQLYAEDGSTPLAEASAAGEQGGFVIKAAAPGRYRVLVSLPQGAAFAEGQNLLPLADQPGKAWLAGDGSGVLELRDDNLFLTDIYVAAYYPAQVSGSVQGGTQGVTVDMLDGEGNIIASTTTQAGGSYVFENPPIVLATEYYVQVRSGLAQEPGAAGGIAVWLEPGQSAALPGIWAA